MTDVRILAGELVLADADGDVEKSMAVLGRVAEGGVSSVDFIVTLARLAAEALELRSGPVWRDELRAALNAISMEGVEDADATDG